MSIPGTIRDSERAASVNRAAIQTRIDAGEVVDLGGGRYCIDAPLVPKNGTRITGVNPMTTTLLQLNPDQDALQSTDSLYVTIEHLAVAGPECGGSGRGIHVAYQSQVAIVGFRDLRVAGFGDDGIRLDRAIRSAFDQVTSQHNGGHGFSVLDGTSIDWRSTYALRCGKAGYHLSSIHYSGLTRAAVDSCGIGYLIEQCRGIAMEACGAEEITGVALKIDSTIGLTATNFRNLDNRGGMIWVTGGSDGIVLITPNDQGPTAQGAFSLKIDEGCTVELRHPKLLAPQVISKKATVIAA